MSNKKLLVIVPESTVNTDCFFHLLVAETGEHLASHLCSGAVFAPGDLYLNRKDRIEKYGRRFGEVDVKFVDKTSLTVDIIVDRNANFKSQNSEKS